MTKQPIVLITGINGYLGHYIYKECQRYSGTIIGTGRQENNDIENFKKFDLLNVDTDDLLTQVDIVIHSAAITPGLGTIKNFDNNVTMTRNLAKACIEKKVKHFILVSSASIYAKSNQPHDEMSSLEPDSKYGKSKLLSEKELGQYAGKMRISILRMGTIFGPDMPDTNNIQRLINAVSSGYFLQLGLGHNEKSLLHVTDAARACSYLAFGLTPTQTTPIAIFNIAPPPLKMTKIIEAISIGLGKNKPAVLPTPAIKTLMKLISLFTVISTKFSSIHNSLSKFLSNDVLKGDKFIDQTNFQYEVDNLQELIKIAQSRRKH